MNNYKYIAIGGSAGSFQIITKILESLPANYNKVVFLTLHRLKHIRKGFVEALAIKSNLPIVEPKDKETFIPGKIYLAPANYHMHIELGSYISLSTNEAVNHSRPSIDLTFDSAAYALKDKLVGIILSGANKDGALGLKAVAEKGGMAIVQNPETSQVKTMPSAALEASKTENIFSVDEIIDFLVNLK